MKREDFLFTIGYQGDTALVDGSAKRQYGGLSTRELAVKGLLKPAMCSALHSGKQSEIEVVLETYKKRSGDSGITVEQLKRILGVFTVPDRIAKAKVL